MFSGFFDKEIHTVIQSNLQDKWLCETEDGSLMVYISKEIKEPIFKIVSGAYLIMVPTNYTKSIQLKFSSKKEASKVFTLIKEANKCLQQKKQEL